jgi:hypothetical protein
MADSYDGHLLYGDYQKIYVGGDLRQIWGYFLSLKGVGCREVVFLS